MTYRALHEIQYKNERAEYSYFDSLPKFLKFAMLHDQFDKKLARELGRPKSQWTVVPIYQSEFVGKTVEALRCV